jgi:hypothetical protein
MMDFLPFQRLRWRLGVVSLVAEQAAGAASGNAISESYALQSAAYPPVR